MDINKTSTVIAVCEKLLKMRLGDKTRLQTIMARAEQGRVFHALDKKYVEKMAAYIKYEEIPEERPPPRPEPVVEEVVPPKPMQKSSFCSGCGTEIPSSNNFCTKCGTKKVGTQPQQATPQSSSPNYSRTSKKQSLEEYENEYLSRVNAGESAPNEQPKTNKSQPPPPSPVNYQRPPQWKSEGVTIILTVILGLFGLGGIGHMYIGKIGKGIAILIVGIILLVVVVVTMGIGLIALIPFAIWVVYDAYKLCKYYNAHLEQHGRVPW